MKALTCPVVLTSVNSCKDGSLSMRFGTPELKPDEKTAIFELLNANLKMLLQPTDSEPAELKEVKGQFDHKTPGQRLRGVIFVLWKQSGEQGEFDEWYRKYMEGLINTIKGKLEPDHAYPR